MVIVQYNYSPSNVLKHINKTIDENIQIFENLLQIARRFNPHIQIYVIQMPMYEEAWKRSKDYYMPWKHEFEDIILAAKRKQDFIYMDLTEHPISKEKECWYDTEHFNYLGALRFTKWLDSYITTAED